MSKSDVPTEQIRLWPENAKRVEKFLADTELPFSVTQLCNWIIANAHFDEVVKKSVAPRKK